MTPEESFRQEEKEHPIHGGCVVVSVVLLAGVIWLCVMGAIFWRFAR